MRVLLIVALLTGNQLGEAFGIWKMSPVRSTFTGNSQPKSLEVRIEPHGKGEVFTLDRVEADGRTTSSSTILYLDGVMRDFQDFGCSGTQSARRMDNQTVEILRKCGNGASMRIVRRLPAPKEMVLEITEQQPNSRRLEQRLVLEKE